MGPAETAQQTPQSSSNWTVARDLLKREVGTEVYDSWFAALDFLGVDGDTAVLGAPTRFSGDWLRDNFEDRIRSCLNRAGFPVTAVRFQTASKPLSTSTAAADAPAPLRRGPGRAGSQAADDYCAMLEPRYTFDTFVVGKSNELAYAAARRVADADVVPFNPLFLHGGVGLGKTHLMHAIAWEVKRRDPDKRVLYMSAERFMLRFIYAMRHQDTVTFKQQFQSVDLLMIDDVQFIAHKDRTQEEFFHTFNALVDSRRQVVISADRSPTDLEGIEERIVSRLGWGLVADIHPTDYELRLGILQSRAEKTTHVDIPGEVLDFLARRVTSNVRELEGAYNRVVAFAELVGRPITMEMVREVLQDLLRANDRKVTVDEIQKKVSDYYNLRLNEMLSSRRSRRIARPRQVAMYLAKQLTSRSLPDIGRKFAGRDHTTVMHAVRTIESLRQVDSTIDEDINRLTRMLTG
ncbi:MAG: chromosomal replication initiator protein DnaA [Rhodothalassiaceae bacterium]